MDFVNDEEADLLNEFGVAGGFSGYNIPFLGSGDDDLGPLDLGFCELHVPSEFADGDIEPAEVLLELGDDLGGEGFHGRDVDDFEVVFEAAVGGRSGCLTGGGFAVHADCVEDCEKSNISFTLEVKWLVYDAGVLIIDSG